MFEAHSQPEFILKLARLVYDRTGKDMIYDDLAILVPNLTENNDEIIDNLIVEFYDTIV